MSDQNSIREGVAQCSRLYRTCARYSDDGIAMIRYVSLETCHQWKTTLSFCTLWERRESHIRFSLRDSATGTVYSVAGEKGKYTVADGYTESFDAVSSALRSLAGVSSRVSVFVPLMLCSGDELQGVLRGFDGRDVAWTFASVGESFQMVGTMRESRVRCEVDAKSLLVRKISCVDVVTSEGHSPSKTLVRVSVRYRGQSMQLFAV